MAKRSADRLVYRCTKLTISGATAARYGASPATQAALGGVSDEAAMLVAAASSLDRVWSETPNWTRYSDGSFPVLYAAKTPAVAISERSHWAIEVIFKKVTAPPPIKEMTVLACKAHTHGKSLMRGWKSNKMLVHPTDYRVCHDYGARAVLDGTKMLVVPSARHLDGVCTPIFQPKVLTLESLVSTFDLEWDAALSQAFRRVRGRKYYVRIDPVYSLV